MNILGCQTQFRMQNYTILQPKILILKLILKIDSLMHSILFEYYIQLLQKYCIVLYSNNSQFHVLNRSSSSLLIVVTSLLKDFFYFIIATFYVPSPLVSASLSLSLYACAIISNLKKFSRSWRIVLFVLPASKVRYYVHVMRAQSIHFRSKTEK